MTRRDTLVKFMVIIFRCHEGGTMDRTNKIFAVGLKSMVDILISIFRYKGHWEILYMKAKSNFVCYE